MKVERKDPLEFKPIVLTITIESADELKALFHRLNSRILPEEYMSSQFVREAEVSKSLTKHLHDVILAEYEKL